MKRKKPFQSSGPYLHSISFRWQHCMLLVLCLFISSCALKPQPFTLRSRTIYTSPGIEIEFKEKLKADLEEKKIPRVLVQLDRNLSVQERFDLEAEGIKLLAYIGNYAWFAEITKKTALEFIAPSILKSGSVLSWVRWVGKIAPEDRVTPEVLAARKQKQDRTEDNRERYAVHFFKNIPMETARDIIKKLGGNIKEENSLGKGFYATFPPNTLGKLMAEETVKLIDLYPPPDDHDNDGSRAWTRTDAVHAAGRTGTGIPVGIWEASGLPRDDHVDLTPARVHWEEADGVSGHATHVAGTLVGTGTGIPARMGHAPGVGDLHCYTSSGAPDEMSAAMEDYGISAANCSYGKNMGWKWVDGVWEFQTGMNRSQAYFGDYRWTCPNYDTVVRDQGLLVVFSSGNDRNDPSDGSESADEPADWDQIAGAESWGGYHTAGVYGTAKNVITVGAVNDGDNSMYSGSNWGPTDDGRIKPDVVAPGRAIQSCSADDPDGDGVYDHYEGRNGTSMAAPAVTGIAALLTQTYREDYLGVADSPLNLLPSTIKALLCHSAEDMGSAGPDYQYGWGGVRADAARQLILDKKFLEGIILAEGDFDGYEFTAPAGVAEIKITMAWDDYPAAADNPDPTLINDLDLVVEAPDGNFYTPWHLHVTDHTDIGDIAERQMHAVAAIDGIPEASRDRWNNVEQILIDEALTGGPLPGGAWKVYVQGRSLTEPPQRYSLVVNEYRLQGMVDVIQVLDRSGSMGQPAAMGLAEQKVEVLRTASDHFVQMMKADSGNQLGLVQFNQDVVDFDVAHQAELAELTSDRADLLRTTTIPSISQGGSTSIGDGLIDARDQLIGPDAIPEHDKVILLVTDGKENTPEWIDGVRDSLIDSNIAVYPLGLGYSTGINEEKLTELAAATGGSYRITADPLIFRKFFIEVLAGAVNWDVIVDPVGELRREEAPEFPVTITAHQKGATFTVYWEGIDNAISFELIPPSGEANKITPDSAPASPYIRYASHPRYAFYQLDFPLDGEYSGEWAGEWQMRLKATEAIGEGASARYSVSAFAEGGADLAVDFGGLTPLTGDSVVVEAEVTQQDAPVEEAEITVTCDVPDVSIGSLLHKTEVDPEKIREIFPIKGDPFNPAEAKIRFIEKEKGASIFKRKQMNIRLFDDGRHKDGKAGDGIYANTFKETRVPGSYTFRIQAFGIPAGARLKTTREITQSFYTGVNIQPQYSDIEVKYVGQTTRGRDGYLNYRVKAVPQDKFGNYLGPGYPVTLTVAYPGSKTRPIVMEDRQINGTYTAGFSIPKGALRKAIQLIIRVDKEELAVIKKLPAPKASLKKSAME